MPDFADEHCMLYKTDVVPQLQQMGWSKRTRLRLNLRRGVQGASSRIILALTLAIVLQSCAKALRCCDAEYDVYIADETRSTESGNGRPVFFFDYQNRNEFFIDAEWGQVREAQYNVYGSFTGGSNRYGRFYQREKSNGQHKDTFRCTGQAVAEQTTHVPLILQDALIYTDIVKEWAWFYDSSQSSNPSESYAVNLDLTITDCDSPVTFTLVILSAIDQVNPLYAYDQVYPDLCSVPGRPFVNPSNLSDLSNAYCDDQCYIDLTALNIWPIEELYDPALFTYGSPYVKQISYFANFIGCPITLTVTSDADFQATAYPSDFSIASSSDDTVTFQAIAATTFTPGTVKSVTMTFEYSFEDSAVTKAMQYEFTVPIISSDCAPLTQTVQGVQGYNMFQVPQGCTFTCTPPTLEGCPDTAQISVNFSNTVAEFEVDPYYAPNNVAWPSLSAAQILTDGQTGIPINTIFGFYGDKMLSQSTFDVTVKYGGSHSSEIVFSWTFVAPLQECECPTQWVFTVNPNQAINTHPERTQVYFNMPTCQDHPEAFCDDWKLKDVTKADGSALNSDFFDTDELAGNVDTPLPSFFTVEQTTETPLNETIALNVSYELVWDGVVSYETATFDVTLMQKCRCFDYTLTPLDDMTSLFGDAAQKQSLEMPSCSDSSAQDCTAAVEWIYVASLADGSQLPEAISFNDVAGEIVVDQINNPESTEVYIVSVQADTEQIDLEFPLTIEFTVTLEHLIVAQEPEVIDQEPQDQEDVDFELPELLSVIVEPSLDKVFSMEYSEVYVQQFTFSSGTDQEELEIVLGKSADQFIKVEVVDNILTVTVDGPLAKALGGDEESRLVSFDLDVNAASFKFQIEIQAQSTTIDEELEEDETSEIKGFSVALPQDLSTTNAASQIYNFTPRKHDESETIEIKATMSELLRDGTVKIAYNPPIAAVPEDWELLFNDEVRNKLEPDERAKKEEQALQVLHIVFVKNSEESDQKYFASNLTEFTSEGLKIKLNFSDPLLVSAGQQSDQVRIKISKSYFLEPMIDPNSDRRVLQTTQIMRKEDSEYVTFTASLPKLMASEEEYLVVQESTEQAKTALQGQFLGSFFLQLFLSGALSMLWNIFNTMQILMAFNLLMVSLPANIEMIYDQFTDIINFQIVPKEQMYDSIVPPIFGTKTAEQLKQDDLEIAEKLVEEGAEERSPGLASSFLGSDVLMNLLGVLLAMTALLLVILLVLCCKHFVVPACPSCFRSLLQKIERKLFWNSVCRAVLETYLGTAIYFFYSFLKIETNDHKGRIELLIWLAIGVTLFLFPIKVAQFLIRNIDSLPGAELRQKYGALYQNVDVYKGPIAVSYSFYFCLRRLLFAYIVTQVFHTIVFQVFLLDFLTTSLLVYYLQVRPMVDRVNNFIQIFNELVVLLAVQLLFLYTNYVESPEIQYELGYLFVYLLMGTTAMNLLVLIVVFCQNIKKACCRCWIKRQLKKAMKQKVADRAKTGKVERQKASNEVKRSDDRTSPQHQSFSGSQDDSSVSSSSESEEDDMGLTEQEVALFSSQMFKWHYSKFLVFKDDAIFLEEFQAGCPYSIDEFIRYEQLTKAGYQFEADQQQVQREQYLDPAFMPINKQILSNESHQPDDRIDGNDSKLIRNPNQTKLQPKPTSDRRKKYHSYRDAMRKLYEDEM